MRAWMLRWGVCVVLLTTLLARAQDEEGAFYAYPGDAGRTVYTNVREAVPLDKRGDMRAIALEQISLNEELAAEMQDVVSEELATLRESEACTEAMVEQQQGPWKHLWRRHGAWIVALGAGLLLLLVSPWMMRLGPNGTWPKLLMIGLPALAFTAVLAVASSRANESVQALKGLANFCAEGQEEEAASARGQASKLLDARTRIVQLYKQRFRALDEMIKEQLPEQGAE